MSAASRRDGRLLRDDLELVTDVIVIGSGPAGAAAAREVAAAGLEVLVIEAGPWVDPEAFPLSAFGAMSSMYRGMGATVVAGTAPMPYVQGRMVGGSSPINGAICWRLPRDIYDEWCADDPSLAAALPWRELEERTDAVEARLGVAPTRHEIAGAKNLLMAKGAEALGLEHRPIRRNTPGCEGLGRCLQGCPKGYKRSADVSLLADAMADGALVLSSTEVTRLIVRGGRAVGVHAKAAGGARVQVRAERAVIVAASAVQTPALLLRSGLTAGPVGHGFSCHPGVSMAGRFREPVRMWEGATQGHEVIGLRHEGLKFEALGFGLGVLAGRLDGVGSGLATEIADMAHWLDWGAAVRAEARGRVRLVAGRPIVTYQPTERDVQRFRRGLRVLGDMMLAAGAEELSLGVKGWGERVRDAGELARFEREGPTSASAYTAAITHMFGTCRMGADARTSVVRPDFRHHHTAALYVADSSVFPSNIGVNPQVPIMALAAICGRHAATSRAPSSRRKNRTMQPSTEATPMRASSPAELSLDDLLEMDSDALHEVMERGHGLDTSAMADTQYLGADLSLPPLLTKLMWKTFRKTFHKDPATGDLRGWNVRMEQTGVQGPRVPMTDKRGRPLTFGHYHVKSAAGVRFPRGWRGQHFLDYGAGGNPFLDFARLGYTPLVAVNEGSSDLLLGWEVFKIGPAFLPMKLYWALQKDGALEEVVTPPRP